MSSNDWYPALDRDHVEVVTDAVSRIEPTGIRTSDGRLHEADVLIWGTGFAATRFLDGIRVTGVDGADLHARWAQGARAHLGMSVPDFPHLFCIYGPHTNLGGSSIIAMLEAQAGYVAQVAQHVVAERAAGRSGLVEVRSDAFEEFDREMQERLGASAWAGRLSWYTDTHRITTNWPGTIEEYQRRLARVDWSQLRPLVTRGAR